MPITWARIRPHLPARSYDHNRKGLTGTSYCSGVSVVPIDRKRTCELEVSSNKRLYRARWHTQTASAATHQTGLRSGYNWWKNKTLSNIRLYLMPLLRSISCTLAQVLILLDSMSHDPGSVLVNTRMSLIALGSLGLASQGDIHQSPHI